MKNENKISKIAVVCALCAAAVTNAFGAATVRSLGGVGTYSGTSAASGNVSGGTAAVRAGSMRVRPSAVAGTVSAPKTTTNGNAVTTSRLSIGKYLGGVKAQTSSGSNNTGSMNPGTAASGNLQNRIIELENLVKSETSDVRADLTEGLANKQNNLKTTDDYIVIENDEIYLDVDALQNGLELADGRDGRDVEIGSNDESLLWRYAGDSEWTELIALSAIRGAQGEKGDKGDAGEVDPDVLNAAVADAVAAAGYVTSAEMEAAIGTATAGLATKEELNAKADASALGSLATKEELEQAVIDATNIDLSGYAKVGDAYTKSESDAKYLTEHQSLTDYAKIVEVEAALADKADTTTVSGLTERVSDAESAVQSATSVANSASANASSALSAAQSASDAAASAKTTAESAVAALEQKADKSVLETLATKEELEQAVIDATDIDLSSYAKTEDVDAALEGKADVTALESYVTVSNFNQQMGDVVTISNFSETVDNITNENVADDAAIARTKLATDVQTSLSKADESISGADAPTSGDYILAVSDGQKSWFEVVTE